jgi:hypothetical protein
MPTQFQALRMMVKQSERSDSAIIVKPVDIRSRVSRIEISYPEDIHTHYLRLRGTVLFYQLYWGNFLTTAQFIRKTEDLAVFLCQFWIIPFSCKSYLKKWQITANFAHCWFSSNCCCLDQ